MTSFPSDSFVLQNMLARARARCMAEAAREELMPLGPFSFTVASPDGPRVLTFDPACAYREIMQELKGLCAWAEATAHQAGFFL